MCGFISLVKQIFRVVWFWQSLKFLLITSIEKMLDLLIKVGQSVKEVIDFLTTFPETGLKHSKICHTSYWINLLKKKSGRWNRLKRLRWEEDEFCYERKWIIYIFLSKSICDFLWKYINFIFRWINFFIYIYFGNIAFRDLK